MTQKNLSIKKTIKKLLIKWKKGRSDGNRSFGANEDFQIRQVPHEIHSGNLYKSRDDLVSATREWRQGIEEFCTHFDTTVKKREEIFVKNHFNEVKRYSMNSRTVQNIRLQTRVYRDELADLKNEARYLKEERNHLIEEMQKFGFDEPVRKALHNPKRRKSISTPYRIY